MKKKKILKIIVTTLVIIILGGVMYTNAISPKIYDRYLNRGINYLTEKKYEESIESLQKAININPKSAKARYYQAKAYFEINQFDNALMALGDVENLEIIDEKLLKDIVELLDNINPDRAYDFLYRYVQMKGKGNLSQEIYELFESATLPPSPVEVDIQPGTYLNDISIKLKIDKKKIGHTYYYTTNGATPNKGSEKYRGEIKITKTSTINIVGYNKDDQHTEIATFEYIIDKEIVNELKNLLSESEKLISETVVGTEVGNISNENKDKLQAVINKIKELLSKDDLNYDEVCQGKSEIEQAIKEFEGNKVKPVNKETLKLVINQSQILHDNAVEGTNENQYAVGSKTTLLNVINEGRAVEQNNAADQVTVDNMVQKLNNAIAIFQSSKVQLFTQEKSLLLIREYRKSIDESKKKEFEGRFRYEPYEVVMGSGVENNLKYFDINVAFKAYPLDGQPFYDEATAQHRQFLEGGTVYRVYENNQIQQIQ